MRRVGGWTVNESRCQPRVESDRLDGADGRGWWTQQLWHTSLSATRIQFIINAVQLVANSSEAGGRTPLLSRGRRRSKLENKHGQMYACAHVSMPTCGRVTETHTKAGAHTHTANVLPIIRSSALEYTSPCLFPATHWYIPMSDRVRRLIDNAPLATCRRSYGQRDACL